MYIIVSKSIARFIKLNNPSCITLPRRERHNAKQLEKRTYVAIKSQQ